MATISSETALIDTNVLVYARDTASPHHTACRQILYDAKRFSKIPGMTPLAP